MRKYYLLLLLGSFFRFVMAQHQQDEEALKLLNQLKKRGFQATFVYANRSLSASDDSLAPFEEKGQITVYRDKHRLTLPKQEVINNGRTVWAYLRDANEVQITDYTSQQGLTALWSIFTNCRHNYTLESFDSCQTDTKDCNSIKLLAKDAEDSFFRITVTVDRNTQHIKFVEIIDSNQTLHIFSITDFKCDIKFGKTFFHFNEKAYPGIEIIDMR